MVLSHVLRFTLPQSSSAVSGPAFLKVRNYVRSHGKVEDQYFGYTFPVVGGKRREKSDEMCWVIQWPNGSDLRTSASFKDHLREVTQGKATKSLVFEYSDSQNEELKKGLEAPITEFAIIKLPPAAPLQSADLKQSMHKTYTDCYSTEGFSGGNWAYAVNSNDVDELLSEAVDERLIPEGEGRLAVYPLGWESVEHHSAYSRSLLFDEEIVKLAPWFAPGTGAWWVTLENHGREQLSA